MRYLFLTLFVVTSLVHLYHSWQDDKKNRAKTKPFLLLFLIFYYICSAPCIHIFLLTALITSWLGDVLLIPSGHKWFIAGGISFMISHFFFILAYFENIGFEYVKWGIVAPMAIIYYGISVMIIRAVKETTPKMMILPMNFYLFCNSTMNLFALMQLLSYHSKGSVMAMIGAALFFASDCCLFLVRYYKKPDIIYKKHFPVMLTYLLGEFLIVQGLLHLAA